MKRKIKVKFVDQCWDQQGKDNYLYPFLAKFWDVEIVEKEPEVLFCSVFGREHMKYDCVKVLFCGENLAPNFNWYDYAIGSDWIDFGDRYLRVPLYFFGGAYGKLLKGERRLADAELLDRKFCSFVVSNPNADPLRDKFFERLSKYKKVDSGGRHMNNVGGPVADKAAFCAQYKFNIAFENSAYPGYTTEKLVDALAAESVPIYWGNPLVGRDFREDCMVRVKDESDIERAVEEIIALDRDDAAYLTKCRATVLPETGEARLGERLEEFLRHVIDQPASEARRIADAGMQASIRSYERHAFGVYGFLRKIGKMMGV